MILKFSLDFPEDMACIETIRLLNRCFLEEIKVKKATINEVEMIIGELCSNVVRHAHSKMMRFLVTLEYYKPKVVITVEDQGQGFVMKDVPPVGTARSDGERGERFGGFGLPLLEGLSDKLNFTTTVPHGTTVRVEKDLDYETVGAAINAAERDTDFEGKVIATKD